MTDLLAASRMTSPREARQAIDGFGGPHTTRSENDSDAPRLSDALALDEGTAVPRLGPSLTSVGCLNAGGQDNDRRRGRTPYHRPPSGVRPKGSHPTGCGVLSDGKKCVGRNGDEPRLTRPC